MAFVSSVRTAGVASELFEARPVRAALLEPEFVEEALPASSCLIPSSQNEPEAQQPAVLAVDVVRPWAFVACPSDSAEQIAASLYGDEALAPVVIRSGDFAVAIPDLLTPELRADYDLALQAKAARDVDRLSEAAREGSSVFGAVLEEVLADWRGAPVDATTQAVFAGVLRAASVSAGARSLEELALRCGKSQSRIRAALANISYGEPKLSPDLQALVRGGTKAIMDRLCDYTSVRDSHEIAEYLTSLNPDLQSAALLDLMQHYDDPNWMHTTHRSGETVPENMLFFLFEDLVPEDRQRLADSLSRNRVLPSQAISALSNGRGVFAKYLPGTTGWAQTIVEVSAETSLEGSLPKRAGAAVLGSVASLWLPETALSTVLALGSRGALSLVYGRSVLLDAALIGAGTGATIAFTAMDLKEAITGRDTRTNRPLRFDERLARIATAGSGVILLGTGAALIFGNGRVTRTQLSAGEIGRLNKDCVRLEVPGMGAGTEVLVTRTHYLAAKSPLAVAAPSAESIALRESALQAAKSAAGSRTAEALKHHRFEPVELAAATDAAKAAAHAAASDAYLAAILAGKTPKHANAAAGQAAKAAATSLVEEASRQSALARAEQEIAAHLGIVTPTARELSPRFANMTREEFLSTMKLEVDAGSASLKVTSNAQLIWQYPDGTVVRYKPVGDQRRPGPAYSVEVKIDPAVPDFGPDGIAFKVDAQGRAVAKGPADVVNPYAPASLQADTYETALMHAGHRTFSR